MVRLPKRTPRGAVHFDVRVRVRVKLLSITPVCVAHLIYKAAHYNAHTQYGTKELSLCGRGRNHGDITPTSSIELNPKHF